MDVPVNHPQEHRLAEIGMGCYRISDSDTEHQLALRAALDAGIRTFDTASTYANGGSVRWDSH
jgi:diketogulonate reductase-like aldo/keto reductase